MTGLGLDKQTHHKLNISQGESALIHLSNSTTELNNTVAHG
jgi:hypothetical protein